MSVLLDEWQKEILACNDNILLAKGRRIGATHLFAMKAVEHLMHNYNPHPISQIVCISLTEDQAKLIIAFAEQYAEMMYPKNIGKGEYRPTQLSLTMVVDKNPRIMLVRPLGTGNATRGFEGQVLMVDEAAFMPKLFWIAAKPILLTTGGKIWMWSTFNGKNDEDFFWARYHEVMNLKKPSRFKVWTKTTEDVIYNRPISKSWTEEHRKVVIDLFEEERKEMSAKFFGQEYMCMPLDELNRFFDPELIASRSRLQRGTVCDEYFLGVDIARMGGDESTFEIVGKRGDKYYHVESIVTRYTKTTQTEQMIKDLNIMYNFTKIGIDAGSGALGVGIYDHLKEHDEIKYKLVAMNNRAISLSRDGSEKMRLQKEDYYDNLRMMLENGELALLDDEKVKLSFASIQAELNKEEDKATRIRIFGSYAHIVEGLHRAAFLARKTKSSNIRIYYV